jgi:hypothetical protein
MLYLNISGVIIQTYTSPCFRKIKAAKERREIKPLVAFVDALYTRELRADSTHTAVSFFASHHTDPPARIIYIA